MWRRLVVRASRKTRRGAHGGGVEGFADASEALAVTVGLLERGYSEEDIARIWGGNFLRVLRAAENAKSPVGSN